MRLGGGGNGVEVGSVEGRWMVGVWQTEALEALQANSGRRAEDGTVQGCNGADPEGSMR
jgi:hypothetical protein